MCLGLKNTLTKDKPKPKPKKKLTKKQQHEQLKEQIRLKHEQDIANGIDFTVKHVVIQMKSKK